MTRWKRIMWLFVRMPMFAMQSMLRFAAAGLCMVFIGASIVFAPRGNALIWGTIPLIKYKHWSRAMREAGWESYTLMKGWRPQNERSDFDKYFADFMPLWMLKIIISAHTPVWLRILANDLMDYRVFLHVLRRARVLHISYGGGPLETTPLKRMEAFFLRSAGIKTVVIPHGGDAYRSSRIMDPALRHTLLQSYPQFAEEERRIDRDVHYWSKHADVIISSHLIDAMPRWDVLPVNALAIDIRECEAARHVSDADGITGKVRIVHAPSSRSCKGTEFIIAAAHTLRSEGWDIELCILEHVKNAHVREAMKNADIFADQLIINGYGMAAIEAMACGLPVICNLSDPLYTTLFRRYSFLNECPVASATPETVTETLRQLIARPSLRRELGLAGRCYVERFHSYEAMRALFGAVYDRILHDKKIDLLNLFHPVLSPAVGLRLPIEHPLVDNRILHETFPDFNAVHLPGHHLSPVLSSDNNT